MKHDETNWLDDAFDEKKDKEIEESRMSSGSKVAIGIGCIGAILLLGVCFVSGLGLLNALAKLS